MESIRKIIRTVLRESLFNEDVIEETQTGQKDLEKFTNEVLNLLADAILRNKAQMAALGESEDEPLYDLPATHTAIMNGSDYAEIGEFIRDTTIRIVPTRLIKGRGDIEGQLEYSEPDKFGNDFFKIWLKYEDDDLDEINSMFNKDSADVTQRDLYFKLFYMFYSTLLHELQHAYDAWRSNGKAFDAQLNKDYLLAQDRSNSIKSSKKYEEMSPEEIEAIGKSDKAYLNLVHEINARYAQAIQKTQLTGMDFDTFDDIKKNWEDVYRQFRTNFVGWKLLSDKMKKKLIRRLAKAYQEESEKLRKAKEKYPEKDLEMVAENFFKIRNVIRESIHDLKQPKRVVGGVLVKCTSTDRVFLLLRNDSTPQWSLVSGTIEEGESVLSGLKREFYEELFINPSIVDFRFIRKEYIPEKNIEFHYYEGFVDKEFNPILDEENLDGKWFALGEFPSPLYDGISEKLRKIFENPEIDNKIELKKIAENEYRGVHVMRKDSTSSPLYDLIKSGQVAPDFYDNIHHYTYLHNKSDQESVNIIKQARNNPDATVIIYRAVPKGVTEINPGDWISLSKSYAVNHGLHHLDSKLNMPVISKKVKAKDIWWDGNDVNEFSYFPGELSEGREVEGINDKTKLSVFDFDSTLVNTPLPETGKREWEQKTGTAWPGGWWGVEESLDTDVFDMTTNPEVISDYRREFSNPRNLVVMMTGRAGKLSNQVEKILSINGLKFHDYLYNDGGETSADKIYKMEMILRYNPEIREIEMWDDRDSHIPKFQRWGEDMISKGYLDNFNINHVK